MPLTLGILVKYIIMLENQAHSKTIRGIVEGLIGMFVTCLISKENSGRINHLNAAYVGKVLSVF